MQDSLIILNFSGAYSAEIAGKLRAESICVKIMAGDSSLEDVMAQRPLGLILAGDVSGDAPQSLDGRLMASGLPVLALGDAAYSLLTLLGGEVGPVEPIGDVMAITLNDSAITRELNLSERYLSVLRPLSLPEDACAIATGDEKVIGFAHKSLPLFGLAFEVERNDPDSVSLLTSFARDVCGTTAWWNLSAHLSRVKQEIAQQLPQGNALCLMTGGLNSAVSALLAKRALDGRVQGLFIDTGFLRDNQADDFMAYYRDHEGLSITRINAAERFFEALDGLMTPAEKRQAFHACYLKVVREAMDAMSFDALVLGTSADDRLFPTGDNFGEELSRGKPVLCPLSELFKDEIRRVGENLQMPFELYQAQPFPDTGLALRVVGPVDQLKLALLRKADALFCDELQAQGLTRKLWKYFAVLYTMPGEEGDKPSIVLRAVNTSSLGNTVRVTPARLPYDLIERTVERIRAALPEIAKVVYDMTPGRSLKEIEWR